MSRRRVIYVPAAAAAISIGRSNSASVSGAGTSLSVGWASGGAAANGTWLIAVTRVTNGTGTITGGSAWTQIGSTGVYYKQAGASEPTTYSVAYSGSSKSDGVVVTICEVIGASSMESSAPATNTSTSPSVTSTAAGDCVVVAMSHSSAAATITPPTGYTKQSSVSETSAFLASAIGTKLNVGSGTIAPGAWNASYSTLVSLAFKP